VASTKQIKDVLKEIEFARWREQCIAVMDSIHEAVKDTDDYQIVRARIRRMAANGQLFELSDDRDALTSFWQNPVEDFWEYESLSAEGLLIQACVAQGVPVTIANFEKVWPAVKPNLQRGHKYALAQRQAAEAVAEQRVQDARKKLRELLLQDFVENFEAARRRDGDIQSLRNIGKARDREEARLASLTTEQLLAEGQVFSAKVAHKADAKRLQNAPLSEVQRVVREQAQQPIQAPRQAYASTPGQRFKQLPADYNGLPWTTRTLERASDASDLRRLLRTYGADALNEAVALNKSKGVV
jgi:hypothetical protein